MQNTRTESFGVFVRPGDFAQYHSGLDRKFMSVPFGTGPRSLSEILDNLAFFHRGAHSGFR